MTPILSVIVPAFNESETIVDIMQAIQEHCPQAQHIYVDDGSLDDTLSRIRAHARPQDTVLTQENSGKGSAIRTGLQHSEGQYTVIQDADTEYHPIQIGRLLEAALSHPGHAVFGSRFLSWNPSTHWRFRAGNIMLTGIANLLFGSRITDSYTCYKLLPTPLFCALHLTSQGFELEAEITGKCLRNNIPIIEVPIVYKPRSVAEGKKIRWHDAYKGLQMFWQERWRPSLGVSGAVPPLHNPVLPKESRSDP